MILQWVTTLTVAEAPQPEFVWLGNANNNEDWRKLKEEIKAERGARCDLCSSKENLDLHHLQARRYGGKAIKENLQLLCRSCHAKTASFGDHSRLQ
jgi:5-methylcytosine-specific restriction endonuclease McrA